MDNKVIGINLSESDRKRYEDVAGMPLTKWFRMLAERECASVGAMPHRLSSSDGFKLSRKLGAIDLYNQMKNS